MNRVICSVAVCATLALMFVAAPRAQAQQVTGFYPAPQVIGYVPERRGILFPRVVNRPVYGVAPTVTAGYAPQATCCQPQCAQQATTYYAPQQPACCAQQQATTYYAPQASQGVASYRVSSDPIVSGRSTTRYTPAVAAPTTAYYAPATTSYYAPAAANTTYYAPAAANTTYYAPAAAAPATTTYYAPQVLAPATNGCCGQ